MLLTVYIVGAIVVFLAANHEKRLLTAIGWPFYALIAIGLSIFNFILCIFLTRDIQKINKQFKEEREAMIAEHLANSAHKEKHHD